MNSLLKQTSRIKSPQLSRNEVEKKPNEQYPIVEELAVEFATTNQKSTSLTSEQGTTYLSQPTSFSTLLLGSDEGNMLSAEFNSMDILDNSPELSLSSYEYDPQSPVKTNIKSTISSSATSLRSAHFVEPNTSVR